ncbi:MAG: DNA repair protein RecN [Peptococcaceae bacterium]|nr:DNA repair protein RecN [Peptococcaceae bacterium]
MKDFALLDDLVIEFTQGFNVLTGETGTGKSLVIDAVQVVLGRRASADYVRTGADQAILEAVFDIEQYPHLVNWLEQNDIPLQEGFLILGRNLYRSGRSIYRINGRTCTLALYREVGQKLVDFHGQGEQQSLLKEENHCRFLDAFGGARLGDYLKKTAMLYENWIRARKEYQKLIGDEKERARRLDALKFQIEEIDAARLQPGEDEELEKERLFLVNAENIARYAGESYAVLYGGMHEQMSAMDLLGQAVDSLRQIASFIEGGSDLTERLDAVIYQVQEVARDIADIVERTDFDASRLNYVEERLDLIGKLQQKYGDSIEDILRYRDKIASEREELMYSDEKVSQLKERLTQLEKDWREAAAGLSRIRREVARALIKGVVRELRDLEVANVQFQVDFRPVEGPHPRGAEDIAFLFSPNPGEPARPLAKIASGGELSRVMLAFKNLLSSVDEVPTLIFDEVDAGIGGRVLNAVAEKMAAIGQKRQVICVTHAPQIACFANQHLKITKENDGKRTYTRIETLDDEGRLDELTRMLGGRGITSAVRQHARELRRRAAEKLATQ